MQKSKGRIVPNKAQKKKLFIIADAGVDTGFDK